MKFAIAILACLALCQQAEAEVKGCNTISGSAERLSCYDKANQPQKAPASSTELAREKAAKPKYVDPTLADDARMKILMNRICRGC